MSKGHVINKFVSVKTPLKMNFKRPKRNFKGFKIKTLPNGKMMRFTRWDFPRYIPYVPETNVRRKFTRWDLNVPRKSIAISPDVPPPSPYIPGFVEESLLHFYPEEDVNSDSKERCSMEQEINHLQSPDKNENVELQKHNLLNISEILETIADQEQYLVDIDEILQQSFVSEENTANQEQYLVDIDEILRQSFVTEENTADQEQYLANISEILESLRKVECTANKVQYLADIDEIPLQSLVNEEDNRSGH